MDQTSRQELLEIIDRQPGLRPTRGRWLRDNWMPLVMFAVWALAQVWTSSDWLHTRESNEVATKREVEALRQQLENVPVTYVRRDVFNEVLVRINEHLASIDNKLAGDRR